MPFTRSIKLEWTREALKFRGAGSDPVTPGIVVDADNGDAPGPTMLLLIAAAGCTASDVVLILQKMRVKLTRCDVEIDGTRRDEEPKRYTAMHLKYTMAGEDLDQAKAERAVTLSIEKYCSVMSSLAPDIAVTHDVVIA